MVGYLIIGADGVGDGVAILAKQIWSPILYS